MIRDTVCDETTNVAKCLYDGGDCCRDNKDRTLCRKCDCILEVDEEELNDQIGELMIKPLEHAESLDNSSSVDWKIEVEEVISVQVCAVLCLDHDEAYELNSWLYDANDRVCKCGWVDSTFCPEQKTISNWTLPTVEQLGMIDNVSAFVQLTKTVACGMYIGV